jgi:crotonobetainyl-CoA:carnitine CoA-transferase CaiB-like acyl-CoA transferase
MAKQQGQLRVIECGEGIGGAFTCAQFVASGAEVIRVETAAGGSPPNSSDKALRGHLAIGKRETTIDVTTPAGADALIRLAETADVVVHQHTEKSPALAGVIRTITHGEQRPVIVEITPFGRSGPRSTFRGGEFTAQASGGYAALCGSIAHAPLRMRGHPFERLTGIAGYIWATAALRARRRGSRAATVDLSIEDTVVANLEYALSLYTWMGLRKQRGITYPFAYPHDLFEVADGHVELSLGTRDAMLMLGIAVDDMELAQAEEMSTEYKRALAHDEFDSLVAPALRRTDRLEFFERSTELRMPSGYVTLPTEVASLPPIIERLALAEGRFPHTPLTPVHLRSNLREAAAAADVEAIIEERTAPSQQRAANSPTAAAPLAGITVLDLTLFYAGPTATRVLSELGADVIRVSSIQSPGRGLGLGLVADYDKRDDPWNRSFYYFDRLAGKREVTLDLAVPEGMDLLRRLLTISDVLVTNYGQRALTQMGLDGITLQRDFPRLVVSQISGYGASGPWANLPAVGPAVEALSGMAATNGYRGGPPTLPGTAIADAIAGYWGAAAVMQLLARRDETDLGGFADVSMLEGCLAVYPEPLLETAHYEEHLRIGNDDGTGLVVDIFPCAGDDRWLALEIGNYAEWIAALEVLGLDESADLDRSARHALVASATQSRDASELEMRLQDAGVSAAVVRDAKDLVTDEHLKHRGVLVMVEQPGAGRRPMARQLPGVADGLAVGITGPAPTVGQHNEEILGGLLGLSADELRHLEDTQVVGNTPTGSWQDAEVLDAQLVYAAGLTKPADPGYQAVSQGRR